MVVVELADDIAVSIDAGEEKPCAYAVLIDGDAVVRYETSADLRMPSGRIGLRNVVFRQLDGYEKEEIGERLEAGIEAHRTAIDEALGPI